VYPHIHDEHMGGPVVSLIAQELQCGEHSEHGQTSDRTSVLELLTFYNTTRMHGKAQPDGSPVLFFTVCEPKYSTAIEN